MRNINLNSIGSQKLSFLKQLMYNSALNKTSLARLLGVTTMCINTWFRRDDIKLSKLFRICTLLGYRMEICLYRPPHSPEWANADLGKMTKAFNRGNLPYLCLAMARYGITYADIARVLGLDISSVRHMFLNNEISLTRLTQIAQGFDLSILITVSATDAPQSAKNKGNTFRSIILSAPKEVIIPLYSLQPVRKETTLK